MGEGYAILVWDEWGSGLVRVNRRLLCEGTDMNGNPKNWWPCEGDTSDEEIEKTHSLPERFFHWRIIR